MVEYSDKNIIFICPDLKSMKLKSNNIFFKKIYLILCIFKAFAVWKTGLEVLRFREKSAILKSQFKASDSDVDRSEQDILQEMKEVFQSKFCFYFGKKKLINDLFSSLLEKGDVVYWGSYCTENFSNLSTPKIIKDLLYFDIKSIVCENSSWAAITTTVCIFLIYFNFISFIKKLFL